MEAGTDRTVVEEHLEKLAGEANVDWNTDAAVTGWLQTEADHIVNVMTSLGRETAVEDAIESLSSLDEEALKMVLNRLKSH